MQQSTDRTVLAVPWIVAEPVPAIPAAVPEIVPDVPAEDPPEARHVAFLVTLAASVAWCIVAAVLTVTGAMFPLQGNVLAYLVLMAGLFCMAFLLLTCPRAGDETPETLWTWGSMPTAAQCTPSRHTLTGRAQR
ncbi:MAG: hypothetical protein KDE23_22420 [Caldilinea sp.]|nr:hypothetical protein [Caldilinea sp.]